ncbi:MAG TPA: hypothetical protein VFV34_10370 [Blastocatellia bacterium]|nr:hypothetical protein [Blastocatellia bacterium]
MRKKTLPTIKKVVYVAAVLAGAITAAMTTRALTAGNRSPDASVTKEPRPAVLRSPARPQSGPPAGKTDLVFQGMLASRLHTSFMAVGNRLNRPGLERQTLVGTILVKGDSQASPFSLIWELPGRARFTEQRGTTTRVLVFDGQNVKTSDNQFDSRSRTILELLVFDSIEHFFIAQASGAAATRFQGSRFRAEDKLENTPYDVVEVAEDIGFQANARRSTRTYYFNSDAHLLDRISYQDQLNGSSTDVDVKFSDWRALGGERIAHRIERLENGTAGLTLSISSVVVGPRRDDGAFDLTR